MDCQEVREWLLRSDDPRLNCCDVPGLVEHTRGCPNCARFAGELVSLERAWREMAVPATAAPAMHAFLSRSPRPVSALARFRTFLRRVPARRWAAAAAIFLSATLVVWLFFRGGNAQAAPDVVERLVDWNLDLTKADSPEERLRIYAEKAVTLRVALQTADLPPADRELGQKLMDNGGLLVRTDDPWTEVDSFKKVAEQLEKHMDSPALKANTDHMKRLLNFYSRIVEQGVRANVERFAARPQNPKTKVRWGDEWLQWQRGRVQTFESFRKGGPFPLPQELDHLIRMLHRPMKGSKGGPR